MRSALSSQAALTAGRGENRVNKMKAVNLSKENLSKEKEARKLTQSIFDQEEPAEHPWNVMLSELRKEEVKRR